MNKYQVRIHHKALHIKDSNIIEGKVVFKTKEKHWLNTELPCIALISVHSKFHEGLSGDIKTKAFISIIREHVKGSISILVSDTAHFYTLQLKHLNGAFVECVQSAERLVKRYQPHFQDFNVIYWRFFIQKNEHYIPLLDQVKQLYRSDRYFVELLQSDAESTYTERRREEYPDKRLFIDKAIEDLLEQAVCILVLSKEGYRYQFYPGPTYASVEYINRTLLPPEEQVHWVNVFLSIEKKKILEDNEIQICAPQEIVTPLRI